jgi:outer membrane protein assembly factor BamB
MLAMNRLATLTCILLFCTASLHAENWPAWRGADGTGICRERKLPVHWSPTTNIRWKIALPEPCNSTPVVWEDRVFLTQGLEGGKRRVLMALDRKTGRALWQRERACSDEETTHPQNPPCSSSPVTDGKHVFAYFASAGVAAYDLDGNPVWHRPLGPVLHRWGNGGSPVLYKDLVILFHGPGDPSTLMALKKSTGETVWKSEEVGINSPVFGSWSTPVIVHAGQRDELIMPLPGDEIGGPGRFKAYDPGNGKVLWQCDGLGNEVYAMPIVAPGGDLIVGISGHNGPTLATRPGGTGDVTQTHRAWQSTMQIPQRIGSGIIHDDLLFISDANGFAECLVARTGESVWKERLGGDLWGSLLLAGDRLYVSNLAGDTFVLRAGRKFEVLAKNSIGEPTYAPLAPSHRELLLRTHQNLYCIGE